GAGRRGREGEAEVDGETAGLLLGESIGVGAREGQDQRRLAVVDVAGGGNRPHRSWTTPGRAPARRSSSSGSTVRRSHTSVSASTRATTSWRRSRPRAASG